MKKSLCIILYHNPSDEVRGKTRRYLYEIKPNVFTGTVSPNVRDHLWSEIETTGTSAALIYSDNNEQGFSYKSTSDDMNKFVMMNGICLPCDKKNAISMSDLYAKPMKKLMDHLIDAGTVAEVLCREGRGYTAIQEMANRFGISEDEIVSSICFLCALHDIGKAHPGFQKHLGDNSGEGACDSVVSLELNGMILPEDETIRHERYSAEIILKYLVDCGLDEKEAKIYTTVVAYHHQGKGKDIDFKDKTERFRPNDERWKEWGLVQFEIIKEVEERWQFSPKMLGIVGEIGINGFLYLILSIMVTADWIVSGSQWNAFPRMETSLKDTAKRFIDENALSYRSMGGLFCGLHWEDVFSFTKNSIQSALDRTDYDAIDFALIECPCGYGKTEAALLTALKYGKKKSGIYIAAPTMATAKGLAKRCKDLAVKAGLDMPIPELDSSMVWSSEDMSKIPKELWTSRTRHQFLYPFAVGTIDQALKTILSYRYSCIGTMGLSDKVLIIDEVHAYDAYMRTELENLIRWCRFLKVPVILLSATLPTITKVDLFRAAGYDGNESQLDLAYPMISIIKRKELVQIHPECNGRVMPIECVRTDDMEQEMYDRAMNLSSGCMALIVPTVDDAFSLYHKLKTDLNSGEVMIFQGRDTVAGKTRKTDELLRLLGKDRSNRPKKLIVVATSIIEQSLDVDFDYMVTALAPIDLLIQRMGRVWRHTDTGTVRETEKIDAPFTIIVPKKYGKLGYLYDSNILTRTEQTICEISKIDTVSDIRSLIDKVYNERLPKEARAQMRAGCHIIDTPFRNESTILADEEESYRKFDSIIPITREETYPTVQVAILEEIKESYTYEEIQRIMQENMICVGEAQIEGFKSVQTVLKYFENIKLFVGDGLVIKKDTGNMVLTDDGLEFK